MGLQNSSLTIEKPKPLSGGGSVIRLTAYEDLAKELDFYPGALLRQQLLNFFEEHQIKLYPTDQVNAYMKHLAQEQKMVWIWRPLRDRDRGMVIEGEPEPSISVLKKYGHGSYLDDHPNYGTYHHAVPIHALRRVKKIQEGFGDKVKFFVSDYAVPVPDPFIMVTAPGVGVLVFDVWDEPNFGLNEIEDVGR